MKFNYLAILLAALSTLIVGFVWYNPKVFGMIWMKETGVTEDDAKRSNFTKIFGLSVIYAFLIAFEMQLLVIHQYGALSMAGMNEAGALPSYDAFMKDYGNSFRTFQHGAFHGFITGLFLIFPVIGTNALFEHKSFKYVMVTSGFWIVCFTVMGGIVCAMS